MESEFRQRILAGNLELYDKLFRDEGGLDVDATGIAFPTTEEEFADMLAEFKGVDFETNPDPISDEEAASIAESLGFAAD